MVWQRVWCDRSSRGWHGVVAWWPACWLSQASVELSKSLDELEVCDPCKVNGDCPTDVNFNQVTKKSVPLHWFWHENYKSHRACVNTTSLFRTPSSPKEQGGRHVIPTSLQDSSAKIFLEKFCWQSLPAWTWVQLLKASDGNGWDQRFEPWEISEKCNLSEGRISLNRTNFILKDRHMLAPLAEQQLQ